MAPALSATACTRVEVSWSGSGDYTGAHDRVTSHVAGDPGVVLEIGKDGARALDPPMVSSIDFELYNDDGRYSQDRGDSPLYQLVLPGRPVRVIVEHGETDIYRGDDAYRANDPYRGVAVYPIADGAIETIDQTTGWGSQRVQLACLGIEQVLVSATISVGLMTAPRVDQCISAILDAVGWPADAREIALADTTLAYWWCDERSPWDALVELLRSEGPGALYVTMGAEGAPGVFHFENRNYRATEPRATASQAAFYDIGLAESTTIAYREDDLYRADDVYRGLTSGLWFTDFRYSPGFAAIRNRATYTTRTRQLAPLGVVWTYGASLSLDPGQHVTLIARPSDPFTGAVVPTSPTDFTVSGGTVSVGLAATSGLVAYITITATSGAPTLVGLQLRAQALTVVGETTVENVYDASGSIARFSPIPGVDIPRVFEIDGWPEIGAAYAQAVCDSWVSRYSQPRPSVELTIQNGDAELVRQIFERAISDRITVRERTTGLSTDFWINRKRIEISGAGGRRLVAVLGCEQCENVSGWLWDRDDALWDTALWGV